jgi:hypothetical protein
MIETASCLVGQLSDDENRSNGSHRSGSSPWAGVRGEIAVGNRRGLQIFEDLTEMKTWISELNSKNVLSEQRIRVELSNPLFREDVLDSNPLFREDVLGVELANPCLHFRQILEDLKPAPVTAISPLTTPTSSSR